MTKSLVWAFAVIGILAPGASAQEPPEASVETALVKGRVVQGGGGEPIAGAKATVFGRVRRGEARAVLGEVVTDADGRFVAGPFPRAQIRRVVVIATPYAVVAQDLPENGPVDAITIALGPSVEVVGRVVSARDLAPLRGIAVATEFLRTETDAEGRFSLFGISPDEPETSLTLTGRGIASREVPVRVETVRIDLGELEVEASQRVAVRVVDDFGKPVAAARVRLRLPTAAAYSGLERAIDPTSTDPNGVAIFTGLPPRHPVVVEASAEGRMGAQSELLDPEVESEKPPREAARLVLGSGRLVTVRVGDATGRPIPGATVTLSPLFESTADFAVSARGQTRGGWRSDDVDPEGRVDFEDVPGHRLRCEVSAPGFVAQLLVIHPETSAEVSVRLVSDGAAGPPQTWPWVSVADAWRRARVEHLPVLVSMALDAERANDFVAAHHFRNPELARIAKRLPVVLANPFGPGGAPVPEGIDHVERSGLCSRYGGVPCSAHHQAWFWAAAEFLPGAKSVTAPHHFLIAPDGEVLVDRPFYLSERDLANLMMRGLRLVAPEAASALAKARLSVLLGEIAEVDAKTSGRAAEDLVALVDSGDEFAVALLPELREAGVATTTRGDIALRLNLLAIPRPGAALRCLLRDPDRYVVAGAERALERVRGDPTLVRDLAEIVGSGRDASDRAGHLLLQVRIEGDRVVVDSPLEGERWRIVASLAAKVEDPATVGGLLQVLREGSDEARNGVLGALTSRGDVGSVPRLIGEVAGQNSVRAVSGLRALERLAAAGTVPEASIRRGITALSSSEPLVREAGARLLAAVPGDELAVLAALRGALGDEDSRVAFAAAVRLVRDGASAAPAAERLLSALDDPEFAARAESVLAELWAEARPESSASWRAWLEARLRGGAGR